MTARPQLPERTPRAKGEPTALDGLLVVDFTRVVACPAGTQTLADFGADVINVENPDAARARPSSASTVTSAASRSISTTLQRSRSHAN